MSIEYVNPPELNDEESRKRERVCSRCSRELGLLAIINAPMPAFLKKVINFFDPYDPMDLDREISDTATETKKFISFFERHSIVDPRSVVISSKGPY